MVKVELMFGSMNLFLREKYQPPDIASDHTFTSLSAFVSSIDDFQVGYLVLIASSHAKFYYFHVYKNWRHFFLSLAANPGLPASSTETYLQPFGIQPE